VVKAPADGIIANLSVALGSGVNIKSATSQNPPVLSIANEALTEGSVLLGESDILKVNEGQEVKIDIGAIDEKKYEGVVRRADSIGTERSGVMKYGQVLKRSAALQVKYST
jgi:multidrug resistance efflux pump